MTKCEEFVSFVDELIEKSQVEVPVKVAEYLNALRTSGGEGKEKEPLTVNGKQILRFMQEHPKSMFKAKDIAEAINVSSRTASGGMRKLVSDGYVEKNGTNPVVYNITEKGIALEIEIDEE